MTTEEAVEIRPAGHGDRNAIQRLWDDAGLNPAAPDEWDALISGETAAVLVARDAHGAVIGCAIAAFDGWRAYVYHVAVSAAHRRRGIGQRLMEAAEQYLLSAGARYLYVTVDEGNTEALALTGSLGYLPEGEIVLAKRLATRVR